MSVGIIGQAFYVMVFSATEDTIRTEKILKSRFRTSIMPTPREISKSCGFAIRLFDVSEEELIDGANTINVPWTLYYLGAKKGTEARTVKVIAENGRV